MNFKRTGVLPVLAVLFQMLLLATVTQAETQHFVPNNINFWYDSVNWSTNFGPAFRDTIEKPSQLVPCTGQFALCFHSGADPLPCTLTKNGKYANCTCTVQNSTNYVLVNAILNYNEYLVTLAACGADGSGCSTPDSAPVCAELVKGKLIPGAKVISTFDPASVEQIVSAIQSGTSSATGCDGAYAACMTAPCKIKKDGTAQCSCPVFHGRCQLVGDSNACSLGGNLIPSASYSPKLDSKLG